MYDGHWFGGGFMWWFWILLIVVVLWGFKLASGSGNTTSQIPKTALDILKGRYARGEINQEEFEQKKKDLNS
ncbi:MAG TPA: SHOCT domain-containing protein [Thiolapillus brandeum]|uniref:SHOCT domain-containing protein n=1 Tax=Thiolapillus brandeum TaxID=1076588 RepID=A0A831K675_9GAMM|nr:SHOCT domain-containing protein [Thiolapillus brandeum]